MQRAEWIGALANTFQPQDKTWFAVMRAGGARPDGHATSRLRRVLRVLRPSPDSRREPGRRDAKPAPLASAADYPGGRLLDRNHRLGRTVHREAIRSTLWTASVGLQWAIGRGGRSGLLPKKKDLPTSTRAR